MSAIIADKISAAKQLTIFDDLVDAEYAAFVDKFKPKKTTDDCYTPPAVYDAVCEYVKAKAGLPADVKIARPFYPGGDYKDPTQYEGADVVIDNPPFSIISQIVRFYEETEIPYFLFAPHLTLFSIPASNLIVCNAGITYENGAKINTSFVFNLFGDKKIIGDPELARVIEAAAKKPKKPELPSYEYPPNVLTVSRVAAAVGNGVSVEIDRRHVYHIRRLDSQRPRGKGIFGAGYLISDGAAEMMKQAQAQAQAQERELERERERAQERAQERAIV